MNDVDRMYIERHTTKGAQTGRKRKADALVNSENNQWIASNQEELEEYQIRTMEEETSYEERFCANGASH